MFRFPLYSTERVFICRQTMNIALFFSSYLGWHYSVGLADFFRVWGNFFWFNWHFFSIQLLGRTLFAPWRRLSEQKKQPGFHPSEAFGNLIVNTIMRFVGFFARLFMIAVGVAVFAIIAIFGGAALFIWIFMPVFIPILFFSGLGLILF